MKKWAYHHSFGALLLLLIGGWVGIAVMDQVDIVLRPAFIAMSEWKLIFLLSAIGVAALWMMVFLLKSRNAVWLKTLLVLFLVMVWLVSGFIAWGAFWFFGTVQEQEVYTSPDGTHSICVTYEAFLAVEWNCVYVIQSPITMRRAGNLRDGRPVRYCEIIWQEESVQIVSGENTVVIPLS